MHLRKLHRKRLESSSRKESPKSLGRPSRRSSQKSLERLTSKASEESLNRLSSKASQKSLERPVRKAFKKNLDWPPRKASVESVKRPSKKASEESLKRSSSKASRKSLERPSSKASRKSLEKPSRKASRKSLERPSRKAPQKSLKKPPRKVSQKSLEMPPSKVSRKSLERPSRNASKKKSKMPTSKVSQKILESNSKAVVLASRKNLESSSKAVVLASQKNLESSSKAVVSASRKNLESSSKAVVSASRKNLGSSSKAPGRRQLTFCVICKRNFTSKKLLNDHNAKHHFFRHCPNCPKTFQQTRKFIFHLRSHLEDHPYECKICLESFNQKRDLLTHKVVHRSSSRLSCDICPEVFPHLASLNRHRLAHYGPPYPCDDCGAIFSNVPDRTVHSKNHVHRCILCPKEVVAFPSNVDLATHMYNVHRMEEHDPAESEALDTFEPCVSTGAVILENDDDTDSMEDLSSSDHESDADFDSNYQKDAVEPVYNLKRKGKFICFICYDLYPSSELLKSHMKAHNWYPCNSCYRFFPDAETFKNHKCDFAEVPIFKCKNCNSECENCKTVNNISEGDMSALQSFAPRFPDMPTFEITDYTDVVQRNRLINFIQHIKSQKGLLDQDSFSLVGFHVTNLKIIIKNPGVNCLFPRHCIHDLEELYSKFQDLIQNLVVRINYSSAQ